MKFEDLKPKARVRGISPIGVVSIEKVDLLGSGSATVIYEDNDGEIGRKVIFSDNLPSLELVSEGDFWTFDGDGETLRLVIEANRIRLAYHFDPYLAIHTSLVEPLPHQITAVYGSMLSRQPLRFLLADDPGAGKTIMAGLLIKELMVRGDVERCLVVAPGVLIEQWQDEIGEKFNIEFDILSREMIDTSRSGNPFNEHDLMIARLDMLARDEGLQSKLLSSKEWDIVIVDEAHRMSASVYGNEVKRTKRYQLGQKLSQVCRHLLLMTATPHNGKEKDFHLFMALLDGDRFEGRYRDSDQITDTTDMMRRLTKEELMKFDETPLFPERRAYTVKYGLSDAESALYAAVTEYVRKEMNRVQRFTDEDNLKKVNIGFALQILQRRLASSPAAICNSLRRRKERLTTELLEATNSSNGRSEGHGEQNSMTTTLSSLGEIDNIDECGQEEVDTLEEIISTSVTVAETIEQLEVEIETLAQLESQARAVLTSGQDTKWTELNKILDDKLMIDGSGVRRKLIIFTEAKDTLMYLVDKINTRLGKPDAVEAIHGGVPREERRKIVQRFMQDKELVILVANDAAGEGVNLQRGHLMVNYDLPWNPNKIEQRFGRIHRIGQTEVCHLWNLVAAETREGDVYARLLEKLETAREALHGRVFDVLGDLFENEPLKDLLWEAIQYGEKKEVRERLHKKIEGLVDDDYIDEITKKKKLTNDVMLENKVQEVRLDMERAEAQRLQPHHVEGFFLEAFAKLGGKLEEREEGRYEVTYIPVRIREDDRLIGRGAPMLRRERICFDKKYINKQPVAEFVCPGHPLLEATLGVIHQDNAHLLRQGAIMVNETDFGDQIQMLFLIEHEIQDGCTISSGAKQTVSKRLQFARLGSDGSVCHGGIAPHLNLRPSNESEQALVAVELGEKWLKGNIEEQIQIFAIEGLAQEHAAEVNRRRTLEINKVEKEVKSRLSQEIRHWDGRAAILRDQEKSGKNSRLSSHNAQRRVVELEVRLQKRLDKLKLERAISVLPPVIKGGLVVIPQGLIDAKNNSTEGAPAIIAEDGTSRRAVEIAAMDSVMSAERALGNEPTDVSERKEGYDIISFNPKLQKYRFIEVKGRVVGADTVTVSKNEILTALNKEQDYALAIVQVDNNTASIPRYVWNPFNAAPSANTVSINYKLRDFFSRAVEPR